jgi:hypothetical protein
MADFGRSHGVQIHSECHRHLTERCGSGTWQRGAKVARFEMKSVIHSIAFAPDGSALFVSPRESGQSVHSTAIWRPPDFNEADAKQFLRT